jgi:hypothetical protein
MSLTDVIFYLASITATAEKPPSHMQEVVNKIRTCRALLLTGSD